MSTASVPVALSSPSHELEAQVAPKAATVLETARAIVVANDEQYAAASAFLTEVVKPMEREINDTFDPAIKQAHSAHKAMLAAKDKVAKPVKEADRIVRSLVASYAQQKAIERAREEARLREEARKREEAERLERAAALEREGQREEAEAVLDTPAPVAPVILPPAVPKVQGLSTRGVWRYRIVDESKVNRSFLVADEKKIGEIVRSMKAEAAAIVGGIEVYEEQVVVAR